MSSPPSESPPNLLRRIGPRGLEGLFGWTFFDPANLVCVAMLGASAVLSVWAMRDRGAPDWYMPLGLYTCLAVFLRGYFFAYYNGKWLGRAVVTTVLVGALLISAALWEDAAQPHQVLRREGPVKASAAPGLHLAALLHVASAVTLLIHLALPRRWLIRFTDEIADRSGRDLAADAPTETIDDPEERARRAANHQGGGGGA